jgi:adenylosuccinate synthase
MKGWNSDISKITDCNDLPPEFKAYIDFIEEEVGVPITMISLGPDRSEIAISGKGIELFLFLKRYII